MADVSKEINKSLIEKNKGWKDVADLLGLSKSTISYKKNNSSWSFEEIKFLAKKLNWDDEQKVKVFK